MATSRLLQPLEVAYDNLVGTGVIAFVETVQAGYGPSVPVSISLNGGIEWSANTDSITTTETVDVEDELTSVRFEYHPSFVLGTIDPPSGPAIGGTLVTISLGSGADVGSESGSSENMTLSLSPTWEFSFNPSRDAQARCLFNGTSISASIISNSSVQCVAPPTVSRGGVSFVRLSLNGHKDSNYRNSSVADVRASYRHGALRFVYLPDEKEMTLFPTSGPVKGGTRVVVSGRHIFEAAALMYYAEADEYREDDGAMRPTSNASFPLAFPPSMAACTFGDQPAVVASRLSLDLDGIIGASGQPTGVGRISCISPPARDELPSAVSVEISLNGGIDFTQRGAQFYYRPEAHVVSVEPAFGPVLGETMVRVEGGPFRDEGNEVAQEQLVRCRFGDQESPATVHSASLVACRALPMRSIPEEQEVEV